jgi:hypothetical protein
MSCFACELRLLLLRNTKPLGDTVFINFKRLALIAVATFLQSAALVVYANEIVGIPTVGAMGVTRTLTELTSDELARQQRVVDSGVAPAPRTPRAAPRPDRSGLPQNPDAPEIASTGDAGGRGLKVGGIEAAAVTVGLSFTAATLGDTLAFPPDTMGAIGPSQFIAALNGRIRSFDKTTGSPDGALNLTPNTFFASVMTPVGGAITSVRTTDPRIRYDRLSGRWFVVMIDVPVGGTQGNRVMIAVSSGGTITSTSSFTFFQFQHDTLSPAGDTGRFADYPTLGIDANALYIGANLFNSSSVYTGTSAYVVRKSSLLSGGPLVATAFRNLTGTAGGAGPYTPQGVDNFDPSATQGYFVGTDNASFGLLVLRRVSNPGGSPLMSGNLLVTVPSTRSAINVPHLGNTGGTNGELDGNDDRLFAAQIRNNRLWTAHGIQVNSGGVASTTGARVGTRWYELDVTNSSATPTLVQSGTVFDAAASNPRSFWIPSVAVSGQGHVLMGFSTAGATNRVDAAVAARFSSSASGSVQNVATYTSSSSSYNPPSNPGAASGRRWGDYSYTSLDPEDDMTMWTIQQFCNTTDSYGVRVAKVLAPPPPPSLSVSPNSVPAGQASVALSITGAGISPANSEGFFDPGASFVKRLSAAMPGVTINSVTYNSPTSVSLNISTVGATAGVKNLTITNPDGQSVIAANALTVTAVVASQTITFPPIASFSWYDGSAHLSATASSGLPVSYTVLSGACALAGAVLTASQPSACTIAADQAGNASFTAAAQQTQAVVASGPALLDIDASAPSTRYDPATDGMLLLRYLLGYRGTELTASATGATATRSAALIEAHIQSLLPVLDVDGDGSVRVATDALLIVRYMLNLRGTTLVQSVALGPNSVAQIESAIGRLMPLP